MTPTTRARSGPRKRALSAAAAFVLLITGVAALTQTASAAAQAVTTGGLDWGVRASFRSYIAGPIAHGTTTLGGGATQNGDGTFHFPADPAGSYDTAGGTSTAAFQGSVHFVGHDGLLDIQISDIRVVRTATGGSVVADVVSVPFLGTTPPIPPSTTYDDVTLVSLTGGTYASGVTSASWTGAASTLTATGAPAFGGFYPAGDAFDPVSFALTLATGGTDPEPEPAVGSIGWRVSQQAWTASSLAPSRGADAPAVLGTDAWSFPASDVTYDPATGATTLAGDGAVFMGNTSQGGYRIKLAEPTIAVAPGGAGTLTADVSYCASTAACAVGYSTPARVVVVTFTLPAGSVTDTGTHVSWTVTPDYPLQNDPSNPTRRQFPQSFLDALPASLQGHFRDSGSATADPLKPPAPLTVGFDHTPVVVPPDPDAAVVQITTEVLQNGGLTISVDDTTIVLPASTLSPDGTTLLTSGALNPITVTDLRLGNVGWNARGQVSDFTGTGGTIAGSALGWTPSVTSSSSGQTVTVGSTVVPNVAQGLEASSALGSAPAGASRGTAVFGGGLELRAPTTTPPGTYTALLTLTVI